MRVSKCPNQSPLCHRSPLLSSSVLIVIALCITALDLFALSKGIDGVFMMLTIAALGAIAGVKVNEWLPKKVVKDK